MLERAAVQHVHAHFGTNPTAVAMLCRVLGGPSYSFTAHGPEEFDKAPFLALGEKVAHSAFACGISEFGRSQLLRWSSHDDWHKVQIVRCGLDAMFLQQPPTPVPDVPRFVCVGRLERQKGQLLLLEAAARLIHEGVNLELLFVGDGSLRLQIERRIDDLDVNKHVRVTGFLSNDRVRDEILNSRAMVMASFAEGLPVVLMESMALARPVIATTIAGIPELVRRGENGWLVTPGSVDQLADAMREVLRTPVYQLSRMGAAGREAVLERHNAQIEARKLVGFISRLAAANVTEPTPVQESSSPSMNPAPIGAISSGRS
jgi:glycosyltransferase involved in cell wall biosynthesis